MARQQTKLKFLQTEIDNSTRLETNFSCLLVCSNKKQEKYLHSTFLIVSQGSNTQLTLEYLQSTKNRKFFITRVPTLTAKVWIFEEVTSLLMHLLSVDHFQSSKYAGLLTTTGNGQLKSDTFVMK